MMRILQAMVATLVLSLLTYAAVAEGLPWKNGDDAPAIAGIKLGDSREKIETTLGKAPEVNKDVAALALLYPERGLVFVLDRDREAAVLILKTRAAGELGGVSVGDEREAVLRLWGEPPVVQGAQAMYVVGNWAVNVELGPDQRVSELSISRVFGNTDLY